MNLGRTLLRAGCLLMALPSSGSDTSHWSQKSLRSISVPAQVHSPWAKTPIDGFVLMRLEERNMTPQPPADRHALVRRVSVGLRGLPPSLSEIEAFVKDQSSTAYENMVDRMLESPHYGERWARHWLDVARFGETDGILAASEDRVRSDAWRYRDDVIRAFNADLPFDQFVRYQLLGSEGDAPESYSALRQFIHLGTRLQNNANPNDRQFHRLDDMVATTGVAFLGVTVGCARCHDHPVDPIKTEEYYEMTAVFFDQFQEEPKASAREVALEILEPRVLRKGRWTTPGSKVQPSYLRELMTESAPHWQREGKGKVEALGEWMTDVQSGAGMQLARVIVNRLWHHHFGQGIVRTPNDFGALGSKPTHPQLLNWLAARLIRDEWRLKSVHRLILNSAVYRQSAQVDLGNLTRDANNEWLSHRRPYRLGAEAIRDHLLSVAGVLRPEMFGESIPIGSYKESVKDTEVSWRRSLYLQVHRTARHPTLSLFDPPNTAQSVGARTTSVGPEGALFSLNAPIVWELAEHFAERLRTEVGDDSADQIRRAYLLALSRLPNEEETALGLELLEERNDWSLTDYCHLMFGLNEFIYVH